MREIREELAADPLVALPAVEVQRSLPLRVRTELVNRGELAGLLLLDRLLSFFEPRLTAACLDPALHRRLRVVSPDSERPGEHEPPHAWSELGRVHHRHHAAVREPEQVELFDAEVLTQRFDVSGVRAECVVVGRIRAGRPAGAEQHELKRVIETGEVAELGGGTARPAGVANEERSTPTALVREGEPFGRGEDLDHGRLPSTTLSRPVRSAVTATPT